LRGVRVNYAGSTFNDSLANRLADGSRIAITATLSKEGSRLLVDTIKFED
jgi:hypothetical protein